MCTVTYVSANDARFITSSRDERPERSVAEPPMIYEMTGGRILMPRDGLAGGSWIVVHENRNAAVLLNGGYLPHAPNPPYRKSRGLILLDIILADTPSRKFLDMNLHNIEPFTAVIVEQGRLMECGWDGRMKHQIRLNESSCHIWSSVTLYDKPVIEKRTRWFNSFVKEQHAFSLDTILKFHQVAGDGDKKNDLFMNRDDKVLTVSITGVELNKSLGRMKQLDFRLGQIHEEYLSFTRSHLAKA